MELTNEQAFLLNNYTSWSKESPSFPKVTNAGTPSPNTQELHNTDMIEMDTLNMMVNNAIVENMKGWEQTNSQTEDKNLLHIKLLKTTKGHICSTRLGGQLQDFYSFTKSIDATCFIPPYLTKDKHFLTHIDNDFWSKEIWAYLIPCTLQYTVNKMTPISNLTHWGQQSRSKLIGA